jgi:hypothetical protein
MRIRIRLFNIMRIRIRLPKIMRIRNNAVRLVTPAMMLDLVSVTPFYLPANLSVSIRWSVVILMSTTLLLVRIIFHRKKVLTFITFKSFLDGVPMVACRVCQNMIDISGKKDQVKHV